MTSLQTFLWQISIYFRIQKFWTAGLQRQRKRYRFAKIFLKFLKFQNILSFVSTPRMYLQCIPVVGCRLHSRNSIKRKLHHIRFSDDGPKFLVQLFEKTLMKSSVKDFSRVMGCRLQSCVILKSYTTMRQVLEVFGGEIIPTKKSALHSYLEYL